MSKVQNKVKLLYLIEWSDSAGYEYSSEIVVVFVSQLSEFCSVAGIDLD